MGAARSLECYRVLARRYLETQIISLGMCQRLCGEESNPFGRRSDGPIESMLAINLGLARYLLPLVLCWIARTQNMTIRHGYWGTIVVERIGTLPVVLCANRLGQNVVPCSNIKDFGTANTNLYNQVVLFNGLLKLHLQ